MMRDFIVWMLSFGLGVSPFLIVQEADAATITATVTAETIPYGALIPDCIQTSTGAYVTCQTSAAGAGGSAGGGFDPMYNQGEIQMNIGADRLGSEQAKASATITFDGTFVTDVTGPVTGTYQFGVGQFWMDPPEILISQDGMRYTSGAKYLHNTLDKMITANQPFTLTTQETAGVPFEIVMTLDQTVRAPEEYSNGMIQLVGLSGPGTITDPDPAQVPEPSTWWLMVGALACILRRYYGTARQPRGQASGEEVLALRPASG